MARRVRGDGIAASHVILNSASLHGLICDTTQEVVGCEPAENTQERDTET